MNKSYSGMSKNDGFFLPLTVVTITIVLFALMTLTSLYEQEIRMTSNLQDQFVIESLFTLARVHAKTELAKSESLPPHETFKFTQGNVTHSYYANNSHYRIIYEVETTKGAAYSLYETYPWAEENNSVEESL